MIHREHRAIDPSRSTPSPVLCESYCGRPILGPDERPRDLLQALNCYALADVQARRGEDLCRVLHTIYCCLSIAGIQRSGRPLAVQKKLLLNIKKLLSINGKLLYTLRILPHPSLQRQTFPSSLPAEVWREATAIRRMGSSEDPASASALGNTTHLMVPKILLRKPGALELFKAPPKDVGEEQLRDLEVEQGFPSLDASVTEWSK